MIKYYTIFFITLLVFSGTVYSAMGISVGEQVNDYYKDSLVIFTKQNVLFLPWLEELRQLAKENRPSFKILLFIDEVKDNLYEGQLLQRYNGEIKYKNCQSNIAYFENSFFPSFYLVNCDNTVIYKHYRFTISDWRLLDRAIRTYIMRGRIPDDLVEYNFELGSKFPIICNVMNSSERNTINVEKSTIIYISSTYPNEDEKRWERLELFEELYCQYYNKIDFLLLIKDTDESDFNNFHAYCDKYNVLLPYQNKNFTLLGKNRNIKLKKFNFPIIVDYNNFIWEKLGYPQTDTIAVYNYNGELVDYQCSVCTSLENLKVFYIELLEKVINNK